MTVQIRYATRAKKMDRCAVIIPARGGSKRIKNKNIVEICESPMIYWPLKELKKEFSAEQIFVSTDSQEIAKVCAEYGVKVPFLRPAELSDDYTGTMTVAAHGTQWLVNNGADFDYVLIVYPTAVLLNVDDIKSAFEKLKSDEKCACVMSATAFPFPIQRAVYTNESGYIEMFDNAQYKSRSQDLKTAYHDAGQFYWCKKEAVLQETNWTDGNHKMHILHRLNVIDIDDIEDLEVAEQRLKMKLLSHRE